MNLATKASLAAANGRPQPVPDAERSFFLGVSPDFFLDRAIPIDARTLLGIIYALSLCETTAAGGTIAKYGTNPTSVKTTVDELRDYTGWSRQHIIDTLADAERRQLLHRTGDRRNGFRYHILIAMRLYRGKNAVRATKEEAVKGERARPIGARASELAPERPARVTQQIPLALAHELPTSLLRSLLMLAQKNAPAVTLESPSFQDAISEIVRNLTDRFGPDEATTTLSRLASDPRVVAARSPIGYLRKGVRPPEAILCAPAIAYAQTRRPLTAEEAFSNLAPGLQTTLLEACRRRRATAAFCAERDISIDALAHAARLVRNENEVEYELPVERATNHLPATLRDAIEAIRERTAPLRYYAWRLVTAEEGENEIVLAMAESVRRLHLPAEELAKLGCAKPLRIVST